MEDIVPVTLPTEHAVHSGGEMGELSGTRAVQVAQSLGSRESIVDQLDKSLQNVVRNPPGSLSVVVNRKGDLAGLETPLQESGSVVGDKVREEVLGVHKSLVDLRRRPTTDNRILDTQTPAGRNRIRNVV